MRAVTDCANLLYVTRFSC